MPVLARCILAVGLALVAAAPALHAQTPAVSAGSSEGSGFIQVVVNRQFSFPYVRAVFDRQEQPFIGLNDLMQAVELSIHYDPTLRSASGYLPDGTTRFVLSVERHTLDIGTRHLKIDPNALRVAEGDLYVEWSVLPEWLPLQVHWNLREYELQATTLYRLPSLDRAAQEARRLRLVTEREQAKGQVLMERPVPWFDPGQVEVRGSSHTQNDAPRQELYTVAGVHRFAGGDLEYSITQPMQQGVAQDYNVDYARLNYYNTERSVGLTLGQSFAAFSPLVLTPVTLQGASFFTGAQPERYGRTTLVGTAQPGSKVDLYRLGVLVDFGTVPTNGVYQFNNLPLGVGSTLFEIRIFTPDGRRYTEYQEISSQENMLPRGRIASQGAAGYAAFNGLHLDVSSVESRAGLAESLTLGGYAVNVQNYPVSFAPITSLGTVGALLLWRPVNALVLTGERAQDSGTSQGANRLDAFMGHHLGTLELDYRVYEGGYNPPARTRATQFSQNALLNSLSLARLTTHVLAANLALTASSSDYGNSRTATEYRGQVDRRFGERVTLFLTEDDQSFDEPGFTNSYTNVHSALASYSFNLLTRVEAQVSVTDNSATTTSVTVPDTGIGGAPSLIPAAATTTTTTTGTTSQVQISYFKNYVSDSPWAYHATYTSISNTPEKLDAGIGYLFKNNLRLNVQADTGGGWGIQLDMSLDFRLSRQGFENLPPNTFRSGGVEGVVYVDENGNGRRDPGESTLPDARVIVSGGRDTSTDESGHYRTWGVPTQAPTTLELDPMSSDALYVPAARKQRTIVHPGEMARVDIPIVPSNGLEGAIVHGKPRSLSPAYGMRLVLEAVEGGVPHTATVEWDGSFVIEGLPPGAYLLHGDKEQMQLKGLQLVPDSQLIQLPPSKDPVWKDGIRFEVLLLAPPNRSAPGPAAPASPPQPAGPPRKTRPASGG